MTKLTEKQTISKKSKLSKKDAWKLAYNSVPKNCIMWDRVKTWLCSQDNLVSKYQLYNVLTGKKNPSARKTSYSAALRWVDLFLEELRQKK